MTEEQHPLIDELWVEASLKRGYGVLRWTAHSNRHVVVPHLVLGPHQAGPGALSLCENTQLGGLTLTDT